MKYIPLLGKPSPYRLEHRRLNPTAAQVGKARYPNAMHYVHNVAMSDGPDPVERLPDAEHLLTLLAVADAGNESNAAEVLGVGQSSINRRLASLQQLSAAPLTKRTASGTRLTPAGSALLPYARDVREALRSAARLLAPEGTAPLRVKLGLSPHLLPRLAGSLASAPLAPEPLDIAYLEGASAELLAAVRAERLDAALTLWAPAGTEPGLNALRLGSDRVVIVAPAGTGFVTGRKANAAELRRSTLLLPGNSHISSRGRALARELGTRAAQVVELSGPAAVRSAVLAGKGVGVMLESYVQAETTAAWLVTAPLATIQNAEVASDANVGDHPSADSVHIWLLINDSVPEEAAQRLTELVSSSLGTPADG